MKPMFKMILTVGFFTQLSSVSMAQVIYDGFTEPMFDVQVAAAEIGRIDQVLLEVGDSVRKGQLVAQLEDSLQRSSLDVAKHSASMIGELEAARAEEKMQATRVKHLRELAEESMARPNELLRAEADLEIATARRKGAEERRVLAKVELERAQVQVNRRKVFAPVTGVVAEVFHHPGEYVTPGNPAVIRLLVVDQLLAVFNVPADEVRQLRVAQKAQVYLRSASKTVTGKIKSIAPAIDGQSGTVKVRVVLDNQQGEMRVGDRCTMQPMRTPSSARLPSTNPKFGAPAIGANKIR